MKRCSKCKEEKPLDAFNRNRATADGLQQWCRSCLRAYYKANREALTASSAAYYAANRDQRQRRMRDYYEVNREAVRERQRQYGQTAAGRAADKRRRAKRRARKAGVLFIPMTPREIRRLYSQPCAHCGTTENLHRDHIVPLARGGPDTFGNSQMLCGSCNSSKGTRHNADARFRMHRLRRSA